jgi:hypothetical protein
VRAGGYRKTAALACGVDRTTYHRWVARGRADAAAGRSGLHRALYDRTTTALAELEMSLVAIVRRGAASDWRAAVVILERRFPARWTPPRQRHEVTGAQGGPVAIEQIRARVERALADDAAEPEPGA